MIIHRNNIDSSLWASDTFAHAPYDSLSVIKRDLRANYHALISLATLISSAESCEFCSILLQGIQCHREYWTAEWRFLTFFEKEYYHQDESLSDEKTSPQEGRMARLLEESIKDDEVILWVSFPKDHQYVEVILQRKLKNATRRSSLMTLEYYTNPGEFNLSDAQHIAVNLCKHEFVETDALRFT